MDLRPILQKLYPDGCTGGQCGVFAHKLIEFPLIGNTLKNKTDAVAKFGIVRGNINGDYRPGDVIVTSENKTYGHVAVINNVVNGVLVLSESNYNLDQKVHHSRTMPVNNSHIVGLLRGNFKFKVLDEKKNDGQRVLILCYNIPSVALPQLKAGVKAYCDKVALKTAGGLQISVDYANTAPQDSFGVITDPTVGTIYVQPNDVAVAGVRVQQVNKKQYNVVCLVYDDSKMAPKPNHPVEVPMLTNGFNIIQIPLDWISSLNDQVVMPLTIYPLAVEIFFSHELSHANYFLANTLGSAAQHDKTHDPQTNGKYTSPMDYFLQYLLELKPWWKFLTQ